MISIIIDIINRLNMLKLMALNREAELFPLVVEDTLLMEQLIKLN